MILARTKTDFTFTNSQFALISHFLVLITATNAQMQNAKLLKIENCELKIASAGGLV